MSKEETNRIETRSPKPKSIPKPLAGYSGTVCAQNFVDERTSTNGIRTDKTAYLVLTRSSRFSHNSSYSNRNEIEKHSSSCGTEISNDKDQKVV